MAVWKQLNPVTGEYEEIPNASCESTDDTTEPEKHYYNLRGKTAVFMGDSYTAYMGAMYKSLCDEFEMICDNRGVGSSTITGDVGGNRGYMPMWQRTESLCEEYTENGKSDDVALVVFMGGANDGFGIDTWLGTNISDTNVEHIYGAMHSILNNLRKTFPNATFLTILQPANYNKTVDGWTEEEAQILGFENLAALQMMDDYQLSQHAHFRKQKIVEEVANFYNTHIIDCCFNWHSILNANDRATYWQPDKLHLTTAGSEDIVKAVREKVLELCAD